MGGLWLKAAKTRGDWNGTAKLLKLGRDEIVERIKASGLRGRGGAGFKQVLNGHLCRKRSRSGRIT